MADATHTARTTKVRPILYSRTILPQVLDTKILNAHPCRVIRRTLHHVLAVRSGRIEPRFTTCKRARILRGKTFDFVPNNATLDLVVATNHVLNSRNRKEIRDGNVWHGIGLGNLLLDSQTHGNFIVKFVRFLVSSIYSAH